MMSNDWSPDEADEYETASKQYEERSTLVGDGDGEDTRYALTALGVAALLRDGAFTGFGPCAGASRPASDPALARRNLRMPGTRKRRNTPLFG